MIALIASILALLLGPLLLRLTERAKHPLAFLDGFSYVAIVGLVLFEILPEAFVHAGMWAIPAAIFGFFAPTLVEQMKNKFGKQAHRMALVVAIAGLMLHAFVDGIGLATASLAGEGDSSLSLAVLLHRLPVGLTIWCLVKPQAGLRAAVLTITGLSVLTILGYFIADASSLHGTGLGLFEALMSGSLLHVLLHAVGPHVHQNHNAHSHSHQPSAEQVLRNPVNTNRPGRFSHWEWGSGLGALVGVFFLIYMMSQPHHHPGAPNLHAPSHQSITLNPNKTEVDPHQGHSHDHDHSTHDHSAHAHAHDESSGVLSLFLKLALLSAPALLLGYIAAGLIHAFLPSKSVSWLGTKSSLSQAGRGVLFGIPLPICSCGVVPVYRSLIMRGAPLPAAMALLIAGPELGLDAILLSFPLLGSELTFARLIAAFLLALIVGAWVGKRATFKDHNETEEKGEPKLGFLAKLTMAQKTAFGEILDHTGPWILLGLLIAAFADPLLARAELLTQLSPWLQVPLFALIGMPLYVCASGATPLVAVIIAAGISPGAGLAFLLTGPATNVTTFGLLKKLHGKFVALQFAAAMLILSVIAGWLTNVLIGATIRQQNFDHLDNPILNQACFYILCILFGLALLRRGPRAFISELIRFPDESSHDTCKSAPVTESCC